MQRYATLRFGFALWTACGAASEKLGNLGLAVQLVVGNFVCGAALGNFACGAALGHVVHRRVFLEKSYCLQPVVLCIVTEMYASPLGRRGAVLLSAAHGW